MLRISTLDWSAVSVDEHSVLLTTTVSGADDASVFDFTDEIERCDKQVVFRGDILTVSDYGVDHSIQNRESTFYILANHV